MSFFGFDSNLPRDKPQAKPSKGVFEHQDPFAGIAQARKLQAFQGDEPEELDFEDTYDGLGDRLDEAGDDLNDDTFGAGPVGRDFDFSGNTAQASTVIGEEGMRYQLSDRSQYMQRPKKTGYEKYQDPGYIPDIQAKSSAWSSRPQSTQAQQAQPEGPISTARAAPPSRKMMSLEEIEAQIRAQAQQVQYPAAPPQYHPAQHMPPPVAQYNPPQPQRQYAPPQQQQQPLPPQAPSPQRQQRVPAQPQSTRQTQQPQQTQQTQQPQQPQQGQPPLQILQNPNRPRHSPQPSLERKQPNVPVVPTQPSGMPVITNPQQLMELSEEQRRAYLEEDAKRAKRNHKIFLLSRGNGLMTPQDKNFITRIQLQQLVTAAGNSADPNPETTLAEDFYYQVYSSIRGAPRQHPTQPLGHFAQTYLYQTGGRAGQRRNPVGGENHMQRMQQQVQRAVEAAKAKPKNKQLIIEGSLGKISFSNAKTPKPLLNIKRQDSSDSRPSTGKPHKVSASDRQSILKNIEVVYTDLMRLEDHERQQPPPPQEGDSDSVQSHVQWREELGKLNAKLWLDLKVLDPIVSGSQQTHPFIALLTFAKGKKAMPRVFHVIDQEQRVTILTMIVVHLDQLDVVRNGKTPTGESQPPAAVRESIDLFSHAVMPSLMSYVSEAPLNIMSGLLGLLLDHTNIVNVVQTRIGLEMLTMLLSRAGIARSGTEDQEAEQWTAIYNRFFDTLETLLGLIFPANVNSGDDMYIWSFLASVGANANPEQQQRLVIGVKDRVMETVSQSRSLPEEMSRARLGNVNLFMVAIGLDVSMLG